MKQIPRSPPHRRLRKIYQEQTLAIVKFAAAQAAQKCHHASMQREEKFAAAQAAQKSTFLIASGTQLFAAAQAAQKTQAAGAVLANGFAAAQAAQKYVNPHKTRKAEVRRRTGGLEIT